LIADSYRGAIRLIRFGSNTLNWQEIPDQEFPAINGLKIYGNAVYASNTEKIQIVRMPLESDNRAGKPEICLQNVNMDDFAFDRDGNLYGTTHIYNSVIKIAPDRTITTIAQSEQGVTGCTALAFGQTEGNYTNVYVVTNGGMSYPLPTGIETAKVVCLDVGIQGLNLFSGL
jgi:sugar lactone lactonase YvrE